MKKSENQYLKKLLRDGYVVIKKATTTKECDKIKNLYFNMLKKYKKICKIKNPLEDCIYNLHNKSDIFLKYLDHKKVINIIKSFYSS